jgi:pimeloyl-ACP methyl ester carboxylesterase
MDLCPETGTDWMPASTPPLPPALDAERREFQSPRAGAIGYYTDQTGAGRPLLLLHSVNAAPSAREMKPLFERFRGQRPVYAPDLPGFGSSARDDREYHPQLYADALTDFLSQVTGPGADLVALSTTAEFAARALLQTPDLGRSLCAISPTGLSTRPLPSKQASQRLLRGFNLPGVGRGLYAVLTSRPSIRFFLNKAFASAAPAELVDYAYTTSHRPGARHAAFAFLSLGLFTRDALNTLYRPLHVPALVLYDEDPNVSFERLPELLEVNPRWRARRIAPSLGMPHWERLEATVDALESFWAAPAELDAGSDADG